MIPAQARCEIGMRPYTQKDAMQTMEVAVEGVWCQRRFGWCMVWEKGKLSCKPVDTTMDHCSLRVPPTVGERVVFLLLGLGRGIPRPRASLRPNDLRVTGCSAT